VTVCLTHAEIVAPQFDFTGGGQTNEPKSGIWRVALSAESAD
jgi:hypothetical protein